jgi:glycosyltransferase involved in cell wall biosynthesis
LLLPLPHAAFSARGRQGGRFVRIGFDMLAVQSPQHGHRGIGRYSRHLVSALLARDDGHQYFLYAHSALPIERIPSAPGVVLRRLGPDQWTASQRIDRVVRLNPDGLDVLVVLSPFELWSNYHPPARSLQGKGPRLAAVVYDLIPFLFPREEVYDQVLVRHYRVLEDLKRYDALLTISEATRRDCLRLLAIPERRITMIGGASDEQFFVPDRSPAPSEPARSILNGLGITRPFVLNVGGYDERKNLWSLIDGFARVPEPHRRGLQLVLTFTVLPRDREQLLRYARAAGVGGALVVTGEVSDTALRVLYQHCTAFVFPSLYEGFGLPLLEAMQCGAAVVAGNNSSQVEVVGPAGLLVNASDPNDIAAKLTRLLQDEGLATSLRTQAVVQARRFRWSETAARAATALEALGEPRLPAGVLRAARAQPRPRPRARPRPRIAFFSPFPPRKSGVSDYSALLLQELKQTYAIDLYHDSGYVPEPALVAGGFECSDARLFPRRAAVRDYHAVVYQMGNSRYHHFLYETMMRYPGIVTLHDFCLAGFHLQYGRRMDREQQFIRNELLRWYPDQAAAITQVLDHGDWDQEAIARTCAERGWVLNRGVLASARRLIVHSPWCLEQLRAAAPAEAERVEVIPHGIWPRSVTAAERAAIRARFEIPREALMVASFGFIHPDKMSPEALAAFHTVAKSDPSALFVFVGEDADGGAARRHAAALGLADRVRFLGRQAMADFTDLIAACDLGVNLRRPPTNGETSGALLYLLASGVATIVNDVATFSDYPSTTVWKVRWETEGPAGLERALHTLAADASARAALGRAAQAYTREIHEWSRVANLYVDVIECCHAAGTTDRGSSACGRTRAPGPEAAGSPVSLVLQGLSR